MGRRRKRDVVPESLDELVQQVATDLKDRLPKELVAVLGDAGSYPEITATFPTRLPGLEAALGTVATEWPAPGAAGWPLGKVVEIYGAESTGKTTLVKYLAARAAEAGIVVMLCDTEQSGVLSYDEALGLRTGRALISQPDTMEGAFHTMHETVTVLRESQAPGLVCLDSVAATILESESERAYDEQGQRAERAVFLSRHLPKLVSSIKGSRVGLVFINQQRIKPGVAWGDPTYAPGGAALKHLAHIRVQMRHYKRIKDRDEVVGIQSKVKVVKNKVAPPLKEVTLEFRFAGEVREVEE